MQKKSCPNQILPDFIWCVIETLLLVFGRKRHVSASRIRSPGSAAVNMCLVACGSADAYYHMGIHCWDMAGGAAVVSEAGGVIVDISGESLWN